MYKFVTLCYNMFLDNMYSFGVMVITIYLPVCQLVVLLSPFFRLVILSPVFLSRLFCITFCRCFFFLSIVIFSLHRRCWWSLDSRYLPTFDTFSLVSGLLRYTTESSASYRRNTFANESRSSPPLHLLSRSLRNISLLLSSRSFFFFLRDLINAVCNRV